MRTGLERRHHAALVTSSATIAVGIFVALNGGVIDEHGSTDSLQLVIALAVLVWLVGVVTYSLVRLPVLTAVRSRATGPT